MLFWRATTAPRGRRTGRAYRQTVANAVLESNYSADAVNSRPQHDLDTVANAVLESNYSPNRAAMTACCTEESNCLVFFEEQQDDTVANAVLESNYSRLSGPMT